MTAQVWGWPDGNVYIWTGTATASAVPAYATDSVVRMMRGAQNIQNLTGTYTNTPTGRRVDVNVGALFCTDWLALQVIFDAETAVHMHFTHNDGLTSGGHFLWSGFVDGMEYGGRERDLFRVRWTYHANVWSAY